MSAWRRRVRFWAAVAGVLLALAGAAAGVYHLRHVQAGVTLPIAPARHGDFLVIIRCRGELRAARSVQISTPVVPNLRIAWLSPAGEAVQAGDPIIRFDSSSAQQQLQQKEAQLRQAQATLDQAVAQARITAEQDKSDLLDSQYTVERARLEASKTEIVSFQDKSDLLDSQYTVERARLEASKTEIVSRLQGEESRIDLGVAEQKMKVEEATVALHAASDKSKIASLTRLRDQAQADVDLTKSRIAQMEIKAPIAGFVVFGFNYAQGYLNAKPFKVGDNAFSGMILAEMPDLDTLELDAKVEETDRGRIAVNQEARVRVDSLPELTMAASVGRISLLAEQSYGWPSTRSFHAYASIAHPDSRLRPGMNGGMDRSE